MKLIILWLTLFVSILFLILPYSEDKFDWFPLSDQKLSLAMHVWFVCEKAVMVALAWIILDESMDYKVALLVFLGVQILKLGDYLICYNEVWGYMEMGGKEIPVSANTVGATAFTFAIVYELIKRDGNSH